MAVNLLRSGLNGFRKADAGSPDLLGGIRELLDGMAEQTLIADPARHRTLRRQLHSLRSRIGGAECLPAVEEALRLLREYNHGIGSMVMSVSGALPGIVERLTATLGTACEADESMTRSLDAIERALSDARDAQDLQAARNQLRAHMQEARLASVRQAAQIDAAVRQAIQECQAIAEQSRWAMSMQLPARHAKAAADQLTGLPARPAAEVVLAGLAKSGWQALVYHLHQYGLIQERYGAQARDRFVLEFSQRLAQVLRAPDTLFRWGDASFVGIAAERERTTQEELLRMSAERHFCDLDLGDRAAMVPITFRSRTLTVGSVPPEALYGMIDGFIAGAHGA